VAALDEAGRKLTLFCVNRHLTESMTARLRIAGFEPKPEGRAQTLAAATFAAVNNEERPEAVVPVAAPFDPAQAYVFRPASVTTLELEKR
jgi:alpha-L-arabinofuranosidase